MENQTNSKSIILNYGLYLGLLGSILHLALWAAGKALELGWVINLLSFIALIVFVVLGIKKIKEADGGLISWGGGLKIGVGIAMISGVISVIYTLLFMNVIDPGFQDIAMEVQQQAWVDAGMTSEQIDASLEMAKKFQGPGIISGMILLMSAIIGFIVSAIAAAIMKKTEEDQY